MHGEVPVADIGIHDRDGSLYQVMDAISPEHAPVSTERGSGIDVLSLSKWWDQRSIPASRTGLQRLLDSAGLDDARALLTRSYGLSLSDQYWIRPEGSDVSWEDVNFFDNGFSDEVGRLLLGMEVGMGEIDLMSPDNTSDGNLVKMWRDEGDGCFTLLKGGSPPFRQEPFNEVAATILLDAMGIDNAGYSLVWEGGMPFSRCPDFIDRGTDLVQMAYIMYASRWVTDSYGTCVSACGERGMDIVPFLDRMIVADYLLANQDRHLYNFGLIRDAVTLDWIRPAPVFDCGASLGYNLKADEIVSDAGASCKPFRNTHEEQMGLVTDLSWVDMSRIRGAIDDIGSFLAGQTFIGQDRAEAVVSLLGTRADRLESDYVS